MVDKVAQQTEVQKVNVKTKTVNPDVVKETGFVNYPGRSCGRWSPISLKAVLVTSVEKGLPQEVS